MSCTKHPIKLDLEDALYYSEYMLDKCSCDTYGDEHIGSFGGINICLHANTVDEFGQVCNAYGGEFTSKPFAKHIDGITGNCFSWNPEPNTYNYYEG